MGVHLINGEFQSDKYPTTPRGKVPLSVRDREAQDLLWKYAQRHERIDPEFSADLRDALITAGFCPTDRLSVDTDEAMALILAAMNLVDKWHDCHAPGSFDPKQGDDPLHFCEELDHLLRLLAQRVRELHARHAAEVPQ